MLIDTHCHIHDRDTYAFALSRQQISKKKLAKTDPATPDYVPHLPDDFTPDKIISRARACGVNRMVTVGTSHADSLKARDFAKTRDGVFWSYGIHPDVAATSLLLKEQCVKACPSPLSEGWRGKSFRLDPWPEGWRGKSFRLDPWPEGWRGKSFRLDPWPEGWRGEGPRRLPSVSERRWMGDTPCQDPDRTAQMGPCQLPDKNTPVAIGEIGLDYRNGEATRPAQLRLFERMLQLAKDTHLPCIFHVREAFPDFFAALDNFPSLKGVVHSFSDSPENLEAALSRGFYIGINGLSTFADLYPETFPPLSRVLLETDAPFLTPIPFRGRVNEPAYVRAVAEFLAEKYRLPLPELAATATKNAETLFNL